MRALRWVLRLALIMAFCTAYVSFGCAQDDYFDDLADQPESLRLILPGDDGSYPGGPVSPSSCTPGLKCMVWNDKSSYGLSETITTYYAVSMPCYVTLTFIKPDGTRATVGPRYASEGTHRIRTRASQPSGCRTVSLSANTNRGQRCSSTNYFSVTRFILTAQPIGATGTTGTTGTTGAYSGSMYGDAQEDDQIDIEDDQFSPEDDQLDLGMADMGEEIDQET